MASRNVVSRIPPAAMAAVRKEVFGQMPQRNVRTGYKFLKKSHTGVFDERWYPESIEKSAREVLPGYTSELEQRRLEKLEYLRRRGKGPPKKGLGKRAQKAAGKKR
uniref:Small ribosomal subunit protein mS33 n=1 Tax=Attheya septentrionalis TaxID=420275 RepID=A0A7S2UR08_9STRA|mmetsp:Transcript_8877/g.16147  ORF Transcript_8877/g.16147 Transcript_8877/m.16147 type:complete len:106 (+) Transcript_8877:30-347(+)|eukprot:CAMPEP_0198286600 /NCGR_PEP_ID=MMETSP1449-20131203/5650_1 /TAXON_ID=420275 /ORGANISM="Attheya septentrionalis, Strain CCMP2084" /LENGTH=105 /DNA_ID=CAMNT_0043984385 /DNA_START=18 /DNA_END=335 /DNA_ORIENTATION=-